MVKECAPQSAINVTPGMKILVLAIPVMEAIFFKEDHASSTLTHLVLELTLFAVPGLELNASNAPQEHISMSLENVQLSVINVKPGIPLMVPALPATLVTV